MAATVNTPRFGRNRPGGRAITFAQYQDAVAVALRERRGLRKGQTFFNVLREFEPELADRLIGTAVDPFYNDAKLPEFVLRVAQELQ
jgi:hypothetical protein